MPLVCDLRFESPPFNKRMGDDLIYYTKRIRLSDILHRLICYHEHGWLMLSPFLGAHEIVLISLLNKSLNSYASNPAAYKYIITHNIPVHIDMKRYRCVASLPKQAYQNVRSITIHFSSVEVDIEKSKLSAPLHSQKILIEIYIYFMFN
jgi:hypothetical protein